MDDVISALSKPFPAEVLRERPGRNNMVLTYVPGHHVIRRLNEVLGLGWNWEVISHIIGKREVIVHGRLTVYLMEPYRTNISRDGWGSSTVSFVTEVDPATGHKVSTGVPICMGDEVKSAATDALKKAATHFGVGLHLYDR